MIGCFFDIFAEDKRNIVWGILFFDLFRERLLAGNEKQRAGSIEFSCMRYDIDNVVWQLRIFVEKDHGIRWMIGSQMVVATKSLQRVFDEGDPVFQIYSFLVSRHGSEFSQFFR